MSKLLLTPAEKSLIAEVVEEQRAMIVEDPFARHDRARAADEQRAREENLSYRVSPHHIPTHRGACGRDVEHVIEGVEFVLESAVRNITALLDNLNTNLPVGSGVNIGSFLVGVADLKNDLIGDLRGAGDQIDD